MRFGVLGPLEVRENGRVLELGSGRQLALLELLLVHANEAVSADRLIDDLWNGRPPASAAKVLQGYVSQLRRSLPPETIATRGSAYLLVAETDAAEFERLVEEAGTQEPTEAAKTLRSALGLWRGRPYVEVEYEPWAQAAIGRLEELRVVTLEERIDADLRLGVSSRLVPELEALAAEHPLRERVAGLLMLALYRSGRQADALAVYTDTRRRLVDELGIEPTPELLDLHRRILTHDSELGPIRKPHPAVVVARRARWLVVAGAVLVAIAAAVAGWEIFHGRSAGSSSVGDSAVVVLDPHSGRIAGVIASAQTPTSLAVGAGSLWTLADQTITRIDPKSRKVVQTFTTAGTPTDLAVGAGALWIVNGRPSTIGSMVNTVVPASVSRLDLRSGVTTQVIPLHPGPQPGSGFQRAAGIGAMAVGRDAVWAIDGSGNVERISPSTRTVVARVPGLNAQAIAVSGDDVWIDDGQATVARIDPRTNRVAERITLNASSLGGIAVGDASIWVADPVDGTVWRIDPGTPVVARTIPAAIGVLSLTFGNGALWAVNPFQSTVLRIDPSTGTAHSADVGGTPQAAAVGNGAAWASVNPIAKGPPENGVQALPATACGAVVSGGGRAQFLIASDLDLRGAAPATKAMVGATKLVLQQHGFRAGKYTVGYQSCDDSTAQSGAVDFATCGANAQAYAADLSLIGVIGPFESGCATAELPIMNRTPSGPLAMISPQTTNPDLTHVGFARGLLRLLYPTGQRNFVRIIAPDDAQGAGDAVLANQLHLSSAYVLDDGSPYAQYLTGGFRHAAQRLGLRIVGVSPWSEQAHDYNALVDRIRRSGAAGVFIAGFLGPGPARLVRELRAQLGTTVKLIVGDGFLRVPDLVHVVGPASVGMYVSFAGRPNEQLPAAGRRFVDAFTDTQASPQVTSYSAAYAAQATEVLLAAIARSDGTRASVTRELFASKIKNGILGSFAFTRDGDMTPTPVTIFRVVGGNRPSSTHLTDFTSAVVDRVVDVPVNLVR